MKNFVLLIAFFLASFGVKAHQSGASTTMLVEKSDGTWVLQISSSLTAFQQEIRTHFAETPYQTPEEFQQMVLAHIENNLSVLANDSINIKFTKGIVRLGHETKVIYEVLGMPKDLKLISVVNKAFQEIYKSKSTLLIFKEGFEKNRFVMNNANDFTLTLEADGNSFIDSDANEAGLSSLEYILFFLGASALLFLAYIFIYKKK